MPDDAVVGFLNIDKPSGWTSHDVVAKLRRVTRVRRIGHAGTLDPLATGVLVMCIGVATRLSDYLMDGDKRYRATLHLGIETSTWDGEGEVIAERDSTAVTRENLAAACAGFVGEITQTPPAYSAIKRNGQPMYRLARRGREVELPPRHVTITEITILSFEPPLTTIDVACSKGTYVRSLVHDVGVTLGCGAFLSALRRLRSGPFVIEEAMPLPEITSENWREHVVAPWDALAGHTRVVVTPEQRAELLLGRPIELHGLTGERCFAFHGRELVAVLIPAVEPGRWRPTKVFVTG